MAITALTYAVGDDLATLEADIAAKVALGAQPLQGSTIQHIKGLFMQAMVSGTQEYTTVDSLESKVLATEAGAGITDGTGTVYASSVRKIGGIYETQILLDLTGLSSSTTDLDIIGTGTSAAHIGQVTAVLNGTILAGTVQCLEAPVGGVTDIDLYSATEGTGLFDGGIAALAETALVTSGGAWTIGTTKALTDVPAANQYLYLTGGAAGTADVYTAGKFLITLYGYDA